MSWMIVPAALAAYLIGSIPAAYFVVRLFKGADVREVGSGRTSSTNAMRVGGWKAFLASGLGDALKGLAAVVIARAIAGQTPLVEAVSGLMAVIGHNWSVYIGFKGGAGTATNIGVAIAFWPPSGLYLVPLVPLCIYATGYGSVASLVIAALVIITFVVRAALGADPTWWYAVYSILAAAVVLWALRPNIERLRHGTERKVGPRARS